MNSPAVSIHVAKCDPEAPVFLENVEAALVADEVVHSRLLGICLGLAHTPTDEHEGAYMAAVMEEDNLVLAALMPPAANLLLASLNNGASDAVRLIGNDLRAANSQVPGLFAPAHLAPTFIQAWTAATGQRYRLAMRNRLYVLQQVGAIPDVPGRLRQATATDMDLVTGWLQAFSAEALVELQRPAEARQKGTQRIAGGNVYLWEDDRPVSMALSSRPTLHGISIGGVYTPPDLRNRGYASACVTHLSRHLLTGGYDFCTLFTDLANSTANHIYQEIGYRPAGDFDRYVLIDEAEKPGN